MPGSPYPKSPIQPSAVEPKHFVVNLAPIDIGQFSNVVGVSQYRTIEASFALQSSAAGTAVVALEARSGGSGVWFVVGSPQTLATGPAPTAPTHRLQVSNSASAEFRLRLISGAVGTQIVSAVIAGGR